MGMLRLPTAAAVVRKVPSPPTDMAKSTGSSPSCATSEKAGYSRNCNSCRNSCDSNTCTPCAAMNSNICDTSIRVLFFIALPKIAITILY